MGLSPLALHPADFQPWVLLGTTLLIFWLLSRMTLLGWADLSYVLPVTSIGYVLNAILGKVFFGEQFPGNAGPVPRPSWSALFWSD